MFSKLYEEHKCLLNIKNERIASKSQYYAYANFNQIFD